MKYKYKINYGGSSFVSSTNDFNAVYELNTLFSELKEYNSDYYEKIFSDYNDNKENFENLYGLTLKKFWEINENNFDKKKIYNLIQHNSKYHIVTTDKLDILIPKINNIYDNYFDAKNNKIQNLKENIKSTTFDYVIKRTLPEHSKIIYLGDYHSSVHSLMVVIEHLKSRKILNDYYKLQPNSYIVFLGDIVDRGPWGIECLYIIYLLFYINNQNEIRIYILNGNHEEEDLYNQYDFGNELEYQLIDNQEIKNKFKTLINYLPLALFIKKEDSKWYQFCHGGIDIHQYVHQHEQFKSFLNNNDSILPLNYTFEQNGIVYKHIKGFLWSDFADLNSVVDQYNNGRPIYNVYQVKGILDNLNIMTIISGHQDLTNYAFLLNPNPKGYPLDENYKNVRLRTFEDIPVKKKQIENSTNSNEYDVEFMLGNLELGGGSKFIENTKQNKEIKQILDLNDSFNFVTKKTIDMRDILASVMSSATISKEVPYSVYGILDLNTDVSEIVYLNPDFDK